MIVFLVSSIFHRTGYQVRALTSYEEISRVIGTADKIRIISFEEGKNDSKKMQKRPEIDSLEIIHSKNLPFFLKDIVRFLKIVHKLHQLQKQDRINVLHVHGVYLAFPGILAGKTLGIKTLFDMHGAAAEESVYIGAMKRNSWTHRLFQWKEKFCIKYADYLIVVSEAMKDYVKPIRNSNLVGIVSCCVDLNMFKYDAKIRAEMRRQLQLEDRFVVVYSGSLQAWQMVPEMFYAYKIIKQLKPNAHFMILTNSDKRILFEVAEKEQINPSELTVLEQIPHEKVAEYLMTADVGLILRSKSLVNQVAFPTKFGEYLACGIPIITTSAIGDISRLVDSRRVGAVITDIYSRESIKNGIAQFFHLLENDTTEDLLDRCLKLAEDYSWESAVFNYLDAYEIMCNGKKDV